MKLLEICTPQTSLLFEGGKALKGVSKITQAEVRQVIPDLLKKIQTALKLPKSKVKLIGSAGKKPQDTDLSGDLDVAVECDPATVEDALKELAGELDSRVMKGIGVYSFATTVGEKLVQVDLMPVDNIKFAEWSYQANPADLKQGFKGAQRNELFFAIAKHMPQEVTKRDDQGEPIELNRYFYDLAKGLMKGTRSRVNKNGNVVKNFSTVEKHVVTNNPAEVVRQMFGDHVSPEETSTFKGSLKAIKSPSFIHQKKKADVLNQAKTGIKLKNLKVPEYL
jgi:hypothetical protein